ncbi:hypothetical protein TTHERM_00994100 (macronuclear) [Tetrahymena thermophila SB210]|uniref:Uncharacterized protein n=1 Tax=Tetrahymena thermophila (strain SB210) TaxID=312017 RepID=Q247T7_TETTS|nr:hypothetical protein TTHERM_00994100 [Tetrahymena thermophila SB210]EAS04013.2 hypothetical protein TTHERM_00994100 [Tetrahymena thermophila SB210]|eukprot:XP_001024258.2 hypothetical protein TTHERM_00994100 [Tetrahymena thermophila SB210]
MGNALCCSERNDINQQKEQSFTLDDAKRRKLIAANSHYSNQNMQDEVIFGFFKQINLIGIENIFLKYKANNNFKAISQNDIKILLIFKQDGRLSTLNPTPTLESQSPTPNRIENANRVNIQETTEQGISDFKLETLPTEQAEVLLDCKQMQSENRLEMLYIDLSKLKNDDTPIHQNHHQINQNNSQALNRVSSRVDDPSYLEGSPNAILSYFQDNRRFLMQRSSDEFQFNNKEYVLLGSYQRDGYEVNQYYSLQTNSVIIQKKFKQINNLHNEVDSSKSFKCCKNLKVFISNLLSVNEKDLTIFYEMGNFRLKDLITLNLLTEIQIMKMALNLVQFVLLSHSNQVCLREIDLDQISLSLSSSQSASGAYLHKYFVQLNNFIDPQDKFNFIWQNQIQKVSDIFCGYSNTNKFVQSNNLIKFLKQVNDQTNMLDFLNHLRQNYEDLMKDTLVDISEDQVDTLNTFYLTEQDLQTNIQFYFKLFENGTTYLNNEQLQIVVNKLNNYIYENFKDKQKYQYVDHCLSLFEQQCEDEQLHELEIIYRIYHTFLCFRNLNTKQSLKQLQLALKTCKNPDVILLYQSLIYALLSLSYIQEKDLSQAKILFVNSNRIYQAHHKNTYHFPRNNYYQILVFAQSLITYKLGYFETSIKRLDYLEKFQAKGKLLIDFKYIWFMKGLNKMELDSYQEAEEYFEKTLNRVTNEETRIASMSDFSQADDSNSTIDKNIFDILIMNILANSFNKSNEKLEQNIDSYQNYNSDYANDNKDVFQILNKILTVIL